jgi:AAA domain (dynein-related subfamily)
MSKKSIYEFEREDRSKTGRAAGALINDRLRVPILKALYHLGDGFHTNNDIVSFLKEKIELEDPDNYSVGIETEFEYRIKWALNQLKNGALIDKDPSQYLSWKINETGIGFLKKHDLLDSDLVDEAMINEIRRNDELMGKEIRYWLYSPGENGNLWEECFQNEVMLLGWDDLGDLRDYNSKEEIVSKLQELGNTTSSKKNDATANFEFCNIIAKGDIVIAKKGREKLLGFGVVDSEYVFDESRESFKHTRRVIWQKKGDWDVDHSMALKTLTDITRYKTEDPKYDKYYKKLLVIMNSDNLSLKEKRPLRSSTNLSLSTILYGPPGTGKTYKSKELAVLLAIPNLKIDNSLSSKEKRLTVNQKYQELFDSEQIAFTTFHQSFSYEDFVEGIKPLWEKSDDKTNELEYGIEAGIFKHCCARAAYNCYKLSKPSQQKEAYTYDDLYEAFIDQYRDLEEKPIFKTITGKEVEIFEINKNDSIRARARGSKATHVAPLTKENLQKLYDAFDSVDEISNLQQVRDAVGVSPRITEFYAIFGALKHFENKEFKKVPKELVEIESPTLDHSEILKKYNAGVFDNAMKLYSEQAEPIILIIDEINRGNVSAIFGELITLLEPDKRIGKDEALKVTLPYSKAEFGVPSNLYIVGTMNTADRSVEALDTALRRRFTFEEIMPDPELLMDIEFNGFTLETLLTTINDRIEVLLDRDHTIGHSYFINIKSNDTSGLKLAFENNIIPLLQEYFYHDYSKIALVLGEGFVEVKNNAVTFAKIKDLEGPEKEQTYQLRSDIQDIEAAVMQLLA